MNENNQAASVKGSLFISPRHFFTLGFLTLATLMGGGGCTTDPGTVPETSTCGTLNQCATGCVDTGSDGANCGACGAACSNGRVCSLGACATTCAPGLATCGNSCVDHLSNAAHCGVCSRSCGTAGEVCDQGQCLCPAGAACASSADSGGNAGVGGALAGVGGGGIAGAGGTNPLSGGATGSGGDTSAGGVPDGSGSTSSGGQETGTGGVVVEPCTNVEPPPPAEWPEATCERWAGETEECGNDWMVDDEFCNESCGRCESVVVGAGGSDGGDGTGGGRMGNGTTYETLSGQPEVNSTRYWDCCKPSCGWSNAGNTHSCSKSNGTQDIGVNDQDKSVCDGGNAQTCHSMAPWTDSTTDVAYGYAAANGRPCGACYQLQFVSQPIAGKTMIVQVTNRGAELGDGHFDLLIPGGGLGLFDGCSQSGGNSLNVSESDLGARSGGIMESCRTNGNPSQCIEDMCSQAFSAHPELEAGCKWSAGWFQGADNPRFQYKEIPCPQELAGLN